MLARLMILPRLRPTIEVATSLDSRNVAWRCVAMVVSQTSGDSLSTPPVTLATPALFTRMSIPPNASSTAAIAPGRVSRLVTSRRKAMAGTPRAFNSSST